MIDKMYMIVIERKDEDGPIHETVAAIYNSDHPPSMPPIWISHNKDRLEQVLKVIQEDDPHHFKIAEFVRSN